METLVGDKIVSAKDFEQARLNYENAKVAWEAVAGKQTANGVSVVSPINGYLKNLQVKEGDYVTVGQPLATISQRPPGVACGGFREILQLLAIYTVR